MNLSHKNRSIVPIILAFLTTSLASVAHADGPFVPLASKQFKDYWYGGKAEISRYALKQIRYGEVREGDAVLIFVTEDFLADEQIKNEGWPSDSKSESILKLNLTKNFVTGVYPYSVMTSTFTPIGSRRTSTLKATASTQEWCGQTYMQLNLRGGQYEGLYHSYFQREGDTEFTLAPVLLEDEIWTRIRLGASNLPTGEIEIVPALTHLRMAHKPAQVEKAVATLGDAPGTSESGLPLKAYHVAYSDSGRALEIIFEAEFPFSIERWSETHPPKKLGGKSLVTEAVRTHTMKLDYWSRNANKDLPLRKSLGL